MIKCSKEQSVETESIKIASKLSLSLVEALRILVATSPFNFPMNSVGVKLNSVIGWLLIVPFFPICWKESSSGVTDQRIQTSYVCKSGVKLSEAVLNRGLLFLWHATCAEDGWSQVAPERVAGSSDREWEIWRPVLGGWGQDHVQDPLEARSQEGLQADGGCGSL